MKLRVAEEFSRAPGPRSKSEGPDSAEKFYESLLEPRFRQAVEHNDKLLVDLDGGFGYSTSFLEEAFGGLARVYGPKTVLERIQIKSEEEPYLAEDVIRYIRQARTGPAKVA